MMLENNVALVTGGTSSIGRVITVAPSSRRQRKCFCNDSMDFRGVGSIIAATFYIWLKQHRIAIDGVLLTIALTACNASATSQSPAVSIPSTATPLITSSPSPPSSPAQSADSVAPDQQAAAIQVIRDYYDAINHRDYQHAYLLWDGQGTASQQSFEQFKQGFANTVSTAVTVGEPGRVDGAAGSAYIEIPVTITAVTKRGIQE